MGAEIHVLLAMGIFDGRKSKRRSVCWLTPVVLERRYLCPRNTALRPRGQPRGITGSHTARAGVSYSHKPTYSYFKRAAGLVLRGQMSKRLALMLSQVLVILLLQSTLAVAQQDGFVSIDCGRVLTMSYTDAATGIQWQADSASVLPHRSARNATVRSGNDTAGSLTEAMTTLRYFPWGTTPTKSCYQLPVEPSNLYLVRAGFFYGDYDSQQSEQIQFQITLQSTVWQDISIDSTSNSSPLVFEAITPSLDASTLSVCLIKTDNKSTPFINTLELRPLDNTTYQTSDPANAGFFGQQVVNFYLVRRVNFGEPNKTLRYPDDPYDRIWPPYTQVHPELVGLVTDISTTTPITNAVGQSDKPPSPVMRTAITAESFSYSIKTGLKPGNNYSSFLFFAEFNLTLPPTARRQILLQFSYNPPYVYNLINLTLEVPPANTYETGTRSFTLREFTIRTSVSRFFDTTLHPVLNADETYEIQTCDQGTIKADVAVLSRLKIGAFSFDEWTGDPCLPVPWDGLQCTDRKVTSMNLSGKNLSGLFTLNTLKDLRSLTSLDLSSNAFTGPFPDFSLLQNLTTLNLANNQFSGSLPLWLQQSSLQTLDVSNNHLNGTFPASLLTKLGSRFRYDGNANLQCVASGNLACALPPSQSVGSSPQPSAGGGSSIVSIVAGTAAVILVIACGVTAILTWYCCCRRQKGSTAMQHLLRPGFQQNSEASGLGSPFSRSSRLKAQPFSLQDIREATNNFARQIGTGGLGPVHHGVLDGDRQVAVKRMPKGDDQGYAHIMNGVDLLSSVHHKNIVPLVGYCLDGENIILLYEYMPGGDLRSRLNGTARGPPPLNWQQRLEIAVDVAKGLDYLHQGTVVHGNLKSSKILLDNKMKAKLAGLGFTKLLPPVGQNIKTPEYLDPEYNSTGVLTDKSDVYSFGIILLELLSGQQLMAPESSKATMGDLFIVDRVRLAMNSGNLNKIVDLALEGEYHVEGCWTLIEIAMSCLERNGAKRPAMTKVASELSLLEIESRVRGSWTNSSNVSGSLTVNNSADTPMPSLIFHDFGPRRGM